ncbi:MAG: TRAP transporter substrate-binding protein DctP [Bacteroidota bacterium]|nr:TRAP transporter substrate-binding protein DctP [Bacteroidota bacterium]
MKKINFIIIAILIAITTITVFPQQYTIKFATVAPDGSTWMNVMKEFDKAIRKESNGRLGFKMYGGMVQGDEKDVLRKIKLGQLHSAGITGVGMTNIASKVRILDSPFLFRNYEEVDLVYKMFGDEFNKAIEEGGFINLGWAEVGFVYVFTNSPVRTPEDMKKIKMWMWEGDPIAEAAFKSMNLHPIPLSINDVLTSLQTGLINGVYSPPLASIALQWFSRVKYMLKTSLANSMGAVVISKKKFNELPPDLQEILQRNGKKYLDKLTQLSRQDNEKSIETLKKNGITIIDSPTGQTTAAYEEIGKKARRLLIGKLYTEDLLTRVEKVVNDYRTNNNKSSQ